jgi:hypothetical protein
VGRKIFVSLLALMVALQIADALTCANVISRPDVTEWNPIGSALFADFGLPGLLVLKLVALVVFALIARRLKRRVPIGVVLTCVAIGAVGVLSNLTA